MVKKRLGMPILFIVGMFFLMVPVADAHVTVNPSQSTTDAYEKYTVRIPVEKEINTTAVQLQVPGGVDLASVLPIDTWDYKLEEDDNGRVTSVIWTANDGGIGPNEFIEFSFIGANPSDPTEVSWKALQTYEDESVVEWVGEPDSEEPASVTTIAAGDTVAPNGDGEVAQKREDNNKSNSSNWIPIGISILALLLALVGLFRKRA